MSAFWVLPEDLTETLAIVRGESHRHLTTSFRVRPGETIRLTDGQGTLATGIVESVDARAATIQITERTRRPRETEPEIVLALAILKSSRMDWAIQKATELGVARIVPLVSDNTVAHPKDRGDAKRERWERVAHAAALQSERAWFPAIGEVLPLGELPAAVGDSPAGFVFCERTDAPAIRIPGAARAVWAVIGPEGGFTQGEVARLTGAGLTPASLGPRILRAETAAVAAVAILQQQAKPA